MNTNNLGKVLAVLAIFVMVLSIVPVSIAKDGGGDRSGSSGSGSSGSGSGSSGFERDNDDDDDRAQENDDGRRGRGRNDDFEDEEDDEVEIEDEIEIEVEIEGNLTKVELNLNATRREFVLNTTDTDDIIREISNRTGLSVQEVTALAEFKNEDDDREDLIEILRDEDDRRRGSNRGRGNSDDGVIRIRNRNVEVEGIISDNTSVNINEAIEIAKGLAPGTVDRVEQEIEDGKIVWKVRIFQSNGARADIRIDAETGNVTRRRLRDVGGIDLSRDFLRNETAGNLSNATIEDLRAEVSELRQEVSLLRSLLNKLSRLFGFGG